MGSIPDIVTKSRQRHHLALWQPRPKLPHRDVQDAFYSMPSMRGGLFRILDACLILGPEVFKRTYDGTTSIPRSLSHKCWLNPG
jgi:hypothetical protein